MLRKILFILLAISIGGCALENTKPFTNMQNTYWKLVSLNGEKVEVFENNDELHFIIKEEQARGSDGCNRFFMPVEIVEKKIKFGHGGSTRKMCIEGMEQSQEFLDTLNEATLWKIDGDILKLNNKDKVIATFQAIYF